MTWTADLGEVAGVVGGGGIRIRRLAFLGCGWWLGFRGGGWGGLGWS